MKCCKRISSAVLFTKIAFAKKRSGHSNQEPFKSRAIQIKSHSNQGRKTKVFVTGLVHSSTTHIMQFIGDVVLGKDESFYLFEFLHGRSFHLFQEHYNFSKQMNEYEARAEVLTKLYNCDFPDLDYNKVMHHQLDKKFNTGIEGKLTKQSLEKKCLSSKHLIFKEIHFRRDTQYYQTMYDQHPNLRIFAMIRNPMTHIPSIHRMIWGADVGFLANQLCIKQLESVKYESSKWSAPQYNLIKMEEYFVKISNDFNQTIVDFNHILRPNVSVNEMDLQNAMQRFELFQKNQWKIGRKNPVKSYKNEDLEYIKNHCKEFAKFNGYVLELN